MVSMGVGRLTVVVALLWPTPLVTMAAAASAYRKAVKHLEIKKHVKGHGGGKECIQQVRLLHDEECEVPHVAANFCHGETCRSASADGVVKTRTDTVDACGLVAHSLLVEFEIFDVVFLPYSVCQAEIRKGEFVMEDVMRVLPINEPLIAVQISGSQLMEALEHGIDQHHFQNITEAYPKMAGINFKVKLRKEKGNRVRRCEILSRSCRWSAIDPNKRYSVLTTEQVASGGYGYNMLPHSIDKSPLASRMKVNLTEVFWRYANNVCTIVDPFQKPTKSETPLKPKVIRVAQSTLMTTDHGVSSDNDWVKNETATTI